jgi:hypothetical protein
MATASMLAAPGAERTAVFPPGFGRRVLLTVDTEEEFDWKAPFRREGFGLSHIAALPRFQAFCERIGAHPVYLVDWPVVHDCAAVEVIGDAVRRGTAEVGIQLHPWVNPPFEEEVSERNSFAGNLSPALEAAKFTRLRDAIEAAFGTAPQIYRAGRYGLGPHTAELLLAAGVRIDTSVRSLFDYSHQGGPDYSHHPLLPYWVDDERRLLELPVTSVYSGRLRQFGPVLHRADLLLGPCPVQPHRADCAHARGCLDRGSPARDRHRACRRPAGAGALVPQPDACPRAHALCPDARGGRAALCVVRRDLCRARRTRGKKLHRRRGDRGNRQLGRVSALVCGHAPH